jgi:hypothetical protein
LASSQSAGHQQASTDPCFGVNIQAWADVPASRVTIDPNFDASVPADFASVFTGNDMTTLFPNGFRKGQVYENNDPPFCFSVPNVQNKMVQVMIQTTDDQASLCLKDTTASNIRMAGAIDRCFTDKTNACFSALTYTPTLTLLVYTDSTAATTSTPFWYRVRVSSSTWNLNAAQAANSAIATLEMWCYQQDQLSTAVVAGVAGTGAIAYPKDLRTVVPPAGRRRATSERDDTRPRHHSRHADIAPRRASSRTPDANT